ncbi:MAG TPA: response regulator [Ktedonobacterales bacterium]|nr:response regulator [Ktedonobacterales bacterium]
MTEHANGASAVLVVEDDEDIRSTLAGLLEDAGYAVFSASDGVSALIRLRTHPTPLVVLLDWRLPGMDGMAVLRAMATDAPQARRHAYLLLTAWHDEARPVLATLPAELSVTLMGKPFNVDDLLAFVAHATAHLRPQQPVAR